MEKRERAVFFYSKIGFIQIGKPSNLQIYIHSTHRQTTDLKYADLPDGLAAMNILRKLFSPKKAALVASEETQQEAPELPAELASVDKPEKKKRRKKPGKAVDPAATLQAARDSTANSSTSGTSGAINRQQPAGDTAKTHMGVSRSHKKILVDYQAARVQEKEVIGDAELEALNNAKAYFLEQDWDTAIDKLSVIIEGHPMWAEPWVLLMDCFFELKDWDRCIELAEELVYFHPDNVSAPCYQATALKELNRTQEAIFICNQAIELFPSSYFLLTIRGDCYFKEEKFKLANESYSRAIKIEKFIDGTQKAVSREVVPWSRQKWRAQIHEEPSSAS